MQRRTLLAGMAGSSLLGACGGGGDGGAAPPPVQAEREVSGRAVVRLASGRAGLAALDEQLLPLWETGPRRTLVLAPADGSALRRVEAPAGWSLVDVALHPSGDLTAVLTQHGLVRLWRLDATGAVRRDQPYADALAPLDPFWDEGGAFDPDALQPVLTQDAARVLALGESVLLVLRTGLNAVVACRLDDGAGGYVRAWRTLVEPGCSIGGRFLTGGSHDVFDQLVNHAQLRADIGADGTLAVGVVLGSYDTLAEAHAWHFGAPVAASHGLILTRLAPDGRRLGSTVVPTAQLSELHALRAVPGGFAVVGRVRTARPPDGSGWDAFFGHVGTDGSGGAVQVLDVDRGDILFDIAAQAQGGYVAVGSTGWTQNPAGASISEGASPLLVTLAADGRLQQRLTMAAGPRHNQLRAVLRHDRQWLVAGMRNGPGTHSGDAEPGLIRADGFVARVPGLA
ncbi:MAG: hypothetical protein Q7U73_18705 [Rubrivivax sp.]|nr:hypothetical protein [Rubrivivax sp.]